MIQNNLDIPWIEKHRPVNISEIYTQNNIKQVLESCIQNNNLPNLLLYGPPGTGKTSTITAMCRQLFGPVLMKSRTLILNASDDRGINIVREKIKQFANMTIGNNDSNFARVTVVGTNDITVTGVTTIAGICDGGLPEGW